MASGTGEKAQRSGALRVSPGNQSSNIICLHYLHRQAPSPLSSQHLLPMIHFSVWPCHICALPFLLKNRFVKLLYPPLPKRLKHLQAAAGGKGALGRDSRPAAYLPASSSCQKPPLWVQLRAVPTVLLCLSGFGTCMVFRGLIFVLLPQHPFQFFSSPWHNYNLFSLLKSSH